MAVLPDATRVQIWRGLQRMLADFGSVPGVLKTDLRAAVNAADSWADSNSTSYNNALPQPFRNNATAGQKALLLCLVVAARYSPEWLKRLAGEVD